MKRSLPRTSTVFLAANCFLLTPSTSAFVARYSPTSSFFTRHHEQQQHQPRAEDHPETNGLFGAVSFTNRVVSSSLRMSSLGPEERVALVKCLVEWQDSDEDIGAAGMKILTEASPSGVLARYYESLAAGSDQTMVLVAPSCAIEGASTVVVERALSSACSSRVYHPESETRDRKAPHFALWHEAPAVAFSPSSVLLQQTATLSESSVMEEIFLWLQRTMLGMVDEEENVFVELGRKLLTVHKYVVANATTEAELARTFWAEVAELTRHGMIAKELMAGKSEEAQKAGAGVGGGSDPREDSVLLALPGFRFMNRTEFGKFVEEKLAGPLRTLSPMGPEGLALFADSYAGEDLKFPMILLFPYLQEFTTPEGGYKFINGRGEEQDADEYIRNSEKKLAQEAAERLMGHPPIEPIVDPIPGPIPPDGLSDDTDYEVSETSED